MLDLARSTHPSIADLKTRLAAIIDAKNAVERDLAGDIDPRLVALSLLAASRLDAAQEAVNQAVLAAQAGDKDRARRRLNVAERAIQDASMTIATIEDGTWADMEVA